MLIKDGVGIYSFKNKDVGVFAAVNHFEVVKGLRDLKESVRNFYYGDDDKLLRGLRTVSLPDLRVSVAVVCDIHYLADGMGRVISEIKGGGGVKIFNLIKGSQIDFLKVFKLFVIGDYLVKNIPAYLLDTGLDIGKLKGYILDFDSIISVLLQGYYLEGVKRIFDYGGSKDIVLMGCNALPAKELLRQEVFKGIMCEFNKYWVSVYLGVDNFLRDFQYTLFEMLLSYYRVFAMEGLIPDIFN